MVQNNNYCVIMAGGIGSRFWPMSTAEFPKQFHDILGTGKTMIQQTFERINQIIPVENIFVITSTEYVKLTQTQLPELPQNNIVGEPMMRNTAACNIYVTNKIAQINPRANIIVLPADHLILKEQIFCEKVKLALEVVNQNNYLITLGIQPTRPDTGYGYIQFLDEKKENIYKVKTFTEKPNLETAQKFLADGGYLWNAGIFIWNVKSIQKAFEQHLPEMAKQFQSKTYNTTEERSYIENLYPNVEKISVDNGILEKADNVFVIPCDLGWSDLGTWTSIFEHAERDENQNTISLNSNIYNAKGNIIRIKDQEKIAVIDGLENYIVVDTERALLICPRSNDQLIKKYVVDLEKGKGTSTNLV